MPLYTRPKMIQRLAAGLIALTSLAAGFAAQAPTVPTFAEVSVHDPSVVRAGETFYVFGSHLASASTADWLHWTQISTSPTVGNPLAPNPQVEFQEALAYVGADTFWAPDVIQLEDGRYYMYYCVGRLDQPRAALGLAVSNAITGPYTNLGVFLRSGMWGQPSHDGTIYDPVKHPNAVDPDVFYDKSGRLWMVYGSYSGGIFILELDRGSGLPLPGQGYGKKLIGGNHSRIEGAFMLYSPESDYYYLFLSYGGLAADGGYNIRLARSRQPDGPFLDAAGTDMTHVSGAPGSFFDDAAIAPHGVKLMGNYQFLPVAGEPAQSTRGYLSPGHNSAYHDAATGRYFLVFHTRFLGRGEEHQVRVHEMFLNDDEWLVAAPHRFAGDHNERATPADVRGDYKLINHGKAISPAVNQSVNITLHANKTVTGAVTGTWKLKAHDEFTLTLSGVTYRGTFTVQWDDDNGAWTHAFTALSDDGTAIWGSKAVVARDDPRQVSLPDRLALYGETMTLAMPEPSSHPKNAYTYSLSGPTGMTIERATGLISWQPTLTQVGIAYPVTVRAVHASTHPQQTVYSFSVTALSPTVVRRVDLDFAAPATNGLQDLNGFFTGLDARLPGTGSALPALDPNLTLDASAGVLRLRTTRADFFGRVGLAANSSPGVSFAGLGFGGHEDFSVTAVFRPLVGLQFIDQVGLYVGTHADAFTRAGTIVWATPERYSVHSENGTDHGARFFGFGFDGSDGMTVTISREMGVWRYFVDGVEWNPLAPTSFLDGRSDLVAGVFAITPLNSTPKSIEIDSITAVVATPEVALSTLEQWRIKYFALREAVGVAADQADPDGDGHSNAEEFAAGTDPTAAN